MQAADLPAPTTTQRPCGFAGRCPASTRIGSAAATADAKTRRNRCLARRIGVAQVGERIACRIAVGAVACIAVEIEHGHGLRAAARRCELFGDEVVAYLEQGILLLWPYHLRIIAAELAFGIGKAVAEVRELARESGRLRFAAAGRGLEEGELRLERELSMES